MESMTLTDEQRQAVFLFLIEAQDAGASVAKSRNDAARQFSITEEQVKNIEREGIDAQWPPLADA